MVRTVFIHNAGGFVGSHLVERFASLNKALADEESEVAERWELIGTLRDGERKPRALDRVVGRDPEALLRAFEQAELTVLDCLNEPELAEAQLAAIPASIDAPKTLIGLSSVLSWSRTSVEEGEEGVPPAPLTEDEYKRRRPQVNFKELLGIEKLVTKSNREGVLRTHVVAAGVTYGGEEDVLHPLFKSAWLSNPLPLLSLSDGSNVLPTIHVQDLCSVVEKLLDNESKPYLLAVDAGQQQEEPQTLRAITAKLSAELGVGEVTQPDQEEVFTTKDHEFLQLGIRLEPAAIDELGFEWHMKEGLLANMGKVVQEYRDARKLNALRVIVHGNDDLAIHALTQAVAAEYKLPHLQASAAVASAAEGDDELAAEIRAAGATISDELTARVLARELTSTACRNQGYVLEGFPQNLEQARLLFKGGVDGDDDAEPPAEEEENGAGPTPSAPEFVVVLEASDDEIKQKQLAQPDTTVTEADLASRLTAYAQHNAEDSPTSLLALPALASVEALALSSGAEVAADAFLSKVRIYLGLPRNYGPSDEEIAAAKALAEQEAAKAAAEAEAQQRAIEAAEKAERERRKVQEARRLAELQMQERELLEVRSQPLRNYLMANVIPTLTEGLIEVCKVKPDDPIDHLAEWLFKNSPVDDDHFE